MRCRPVAVQVGLQFDILAVHFNSLCVVANGAVEIFPAVLTVTFIPVNLSYCFNLAI